MTSAKILIDGGPGTGKTTFVGSVSDIDPVLTEVPTTAEAGGRTTTAALDFGRVTVDGDLTLLLFGTPSTGRLPFMHDDLARGALGAVILVDPRRPADSYPAIGSAERRGLPFVVAVNPIGRDRSELDQAIRMGPEVPISICDARDRASAKATLLTLFDIVLDTTLSRGAVGKPVRCTDTAAMDTATLVGLAPDLRRPDRPATVESTNREAP